MEDPKPKFVNVKKEEYYDVFETYILNTCKKEEYFLIRYLPKTEGKGLWYMYEEGAYKEVPRQVIERFYYEAMDIKLEHKSTGNLTFCMNALKGWVLMAWADWQDHDPEWENCLDGMINLYERKLYPHHPKFMMKRQTPRHFFADVVLIPEKFDRLMTIFLDDYVREKFIKFFLAVVHKKMEWQKFVLLYGETGSGKSTVLQIFAEIYGKLQASHTKLQVMGKRFGLDDMYDKRVNVHADLPMVDIGPYTISEVKMLTGEDGGDITVEIKGATKFNYPINCFLAFGINELVGFTDKAEKEIDSWMKRAVLCECPQILPEDSEFKKSIRDATFLDELYSWAINTRPMRFYDPGEEKEWIRMNKEEWLLKCNPILRILKENYEWCAPDEAPDLTKIVQKIPCDEVEFFVRDELLNNGDLVPSQLRNKITVAFRAIKVGRNSKTGGKAKYINVVKKLEVQKDD